MVSTTREDHEAAGDGQLGSVLEDERAARDRRRTAAGWPPSDARRRGVAGLAPLVTCRERGVAWRMMRSGVASLARQRGRRLTFAEDDDAVGERQQLGQLAGHQDDAQAGARSGRR